MIILDEVTSTQDVLAEAVRTGSGVTIVVARHQTMGRGRFDRVWVDTRGESLTMSLAVHEASNHPQPWLIGMVLALIAAEVLDLKVQWPNDLTLDSRKVGGVLTEMVVTPAGARVPIIGIGINLNQRAFSPPIDATATSLWLARGTEYSLEETATEIVQRFQLEPIPTGWWSINDRWQARDLTPGKSFALPGGDVVIAKGIGQMGELLTTDGKSIYAADALS